MSNNFQIISKGLYRGTVDKGFLVEVKEYVFTRQKGKKFLLLRFLNESKNSFTAMHFWLIQKDVQGQEIYKEKISLEGIYCGAGAMFTPNTCFPVQNKCVDFEVKMISAFSGDYEYRLENDEVLVRYTNTLDNKFSTRRKHYCVQRKKLNRKIKLLGWIMVLSIFLIFLATIFPFFISDICPAIIRLVVFLVRLFVIVCDYLFDLAIDILREIVRYFENTRA